MSATTTDRRETTGFVGQALRRPIQEAVREGVEEALREQRATVRTRPGGDSDDEGGRSWGRLALLALIGLGAAYVMMRRRGGSDGLDPSTGEIRERSKTAPAQPDVGGEGSVGAMEEEEGAAPGAGSEDD